MKSSVARGFVAFSALILVFTSSVFSQDEMGEPMSAPARPTKEKDRNSPKPSESAPTEGGLLAGPAVEVEPENGRPAGPDGPNQASKHRRGEQVPLRKWMTALRGVGLSEAQRQEVQVVAKEFQAAVASHMDEFTPNEREKIRQAMEQRRGGGKKASEPAGKPGRKRGEDMDPALKELAKKMEDGRPNPKPYQERIWEILTAEQQAKMKENLANLSKASGPRAKGQGKGRNPESTNGESMAPPMGDAANHDQDEPRMTPPPRKPRERKEAPGREPSADDREIIIDDSNGS